MERFMSIKCGKNNIAKIQKYQVIYQGCDGILEITESCPYADRNKECSNCYGKVVKLVYEQFESNTGKFEKKTIIKKDTFLLGQDSISKKLDASELEYKCSVIRGVKKTESNNIVGKTSFLYTAYDRPQNYKTACKECKFKYGSSTPCKQVQENRLKGLPDNFCGEQTQRVIKF